MTDRPLSSDPTSTAPLADAAAWAQEVLRRQVVLLEQFAEEGLRLGQAIARLVTDQPAEASAKEGPAPETIAMAFSRVARAVRMTALLQSRLLKDMEEARARRSAEWRAQIETQIQVEDDDAEQARRLDPLYRHKSRVENIVERVPRKAGRDEDRLDRLMIEAGERLDDEDIYGDVLTRPVGELVALICRDLGLDPDWTRLAEEAWAQEEIRIGAEGSPFLHLLPSRPPSFTAVNGRGGPPADPGESRGEERVVVGAGRRTFAFNGSS